MSDAHAVARDQLRSFIERIERLEEEKKTIADDIKDVKAEAKGCGFDVGIINAVLKLRKIDANERAERDAMLDTYLIALGMLPEPAGEDEDYDRETGEVTIIDRDDEDGNQIRVTVDPQIAAILGRQSDVPLRSDGGLSILTKHEDIRTAPVTAEESQANPVEEGEHGGCDEAVPTVEAGSRAAEERERQHALTVGFADDCRTGGKEQSDASAAPVGDAAAYAHGIPAISPDQPGEGGADEVTSSAPGAGDETQTSNTGEGAANIALPAKPKVSFRPNCQHPENCASGTRDHCWSCRRAMQKSEEMA